VVSPRVRRPDAEITEAAENLVLKALAKDPMQRYQTMDEVYGELQKCFGSVRFRRAVQVLPAGAAADAVRSAPIQLTNVKRKNADPQGIPANLAPPAALHARGPVPPPSAPARRTPTPPEVTPAPILLTRRKSGRHKTLPFGNEVAPQVFAGEIDTPPPYVTPAPLVTVPAGGSTARGQGHSGGTQTGPGKPPRR
jgi:hypothetical protein